MITSTTARRSRRVATTIAAAALSAGVLAATLSSAPAAHAAGPVIDCTSDPAILSTGYDGAGGRLTTGTDLGWTYAVNPSPGFAPAVIVDQPPTGFWTTSPYDNASWISHSSTGLHTGYVQAFYRYTFELAPEVDPQGFSVSLDFFADNSVQEVRVNGAAQSPYIDDVPQATGFGAYTYLGYTAENGASATLDRNWRTGENTIQVMIYSEQYNQGFLAQTTSTAFCADYGDAPASYGTAKADGGASHLLEGFDGDSAPLMLGGSVDTEADAAGLTGTGDDSTGIDDETGVAALPAISALSTEYSVPVSVTNETGGTATLAGWIDFDGDGTFSADERATAPVAPGASSAVLDWSGIQPVAGDTASRFRLYDGVVEDPSPVGRVSGGEVEDYPLTVAPGTLQYLKVADVATADEGDVVEYTITVHNDSTVPVAGASFSDDLADVLDDAVYLEGAADTGALAFDQGVLTWVGDLAADQTATITYSVRVASTPSGDRTLENVVVDTSRPDPGVSNCPVGSADPDCTSIVTAGAPLDFGDAPDSFGTESTGHVLEDFDGRAGSAALGLGDLVDGEKAPSGDDNETGIADEDSIDSALGLSEADRTYSIDVVLHNETTAGATLAGWIDLDGDGQFGSSERATAAVEPGATSARLTWTGITPVSGDSHLRVRLFEGDVADPQPTGRVAGGEVEDYPVDITPVVNLSAPPSGILAFTGSALPWVGGAAGVALLLVGAVVLLVRRRA